jgi:hypothetical protein
MRINFRRLKLTPVYIKNQSDNNIGLRNNYVENLSMMMSYCRNEYQLDREKFCSQFELSDDFEEALDKI